MAIWTGVIAFGLVSIPIKVQAATESHDLALHQYHEADGGRVRYQKICELDEQPVPTEEIVKGWETADDVVLLDDDDLADLPVSASKTIEVLQFVPVEEVDPIHYEKPYYLEPGKAGGRPYLLLREALLAKRQVAIVKVVMRQRESLGVLRAREGVLVLHTMRWPDEIREPQVNLEGEAPAQELELAGTLIDAMSGEFHPEQYVDDYQEALLAAIEAKQEGRKLSKAKPQPAGAKVINLMDALKKSVEQSARPQRPAKKSTKKATARKSTAKKAAKRSPTRDER